MNLIQFVLQLCLSAYPDYKNPVITPLAQKCVNYVIECSVSSATDDKITSTQVEACFADYLRKVGKEDV